MARDFRLKGERDREDLFAATPSFVVVEDAHLEDMHCHEESVQEEDVVR